MSKAPHQVVEALARLHSHAGSQRDKQIPPPVTVAISRQAGARGAEIGRAVGALLGWPVYDHELLTRIASDKGLQARLLEHLDERHVSWLQEIAASFCAQSTPTEGTYFKELLRLLASLGRAGHCVIIGRGATHLLPRETTLRVRVFAPRAARIANTEKRQGVSKDEAERWVDQTDSERDRFIRYHFQKDAGDPLEYDLMLNSGTYSTCACAALIAQATRLLEEQANTSLAR